MRAREFVVGVLSLGLLAGCIEDRSGTSTSVSSTGPGSAGTVSLQAGESHSSSVPEQGWRHHFIQVPEGQEVLRVSGRVSGMTGEVEFVVVHEQKPDDAILGSHSLPCSDVASTETGSSTFSCEIVDPEEGRWYVSVRGRMGLSSYGTRALYGSNLALAQNGGGATATYDPDGASVVINGFTEGDFWAGMQAGDAVLVTFDQEYRILDIKVHGEIESAWPLAVSLLEASDESLDEGIFYFLVNGNNSPTNTSCVSMRITDAGLFCGLSEDAPALRTLVVELEEGNATQSGTGVVIHEIEAIGIPVDE